MARDHRDRDTPTERNYRRFKMNRLALAGFRRALWVIDQWIRLRYPYHRGESTVTCQTALDIAEELVALGGLDLIALGEAGDESPAETERRFQAARCRRNH